MAVKLSTLVEENNMLRSTLQEEVEDIREWQNGIDKRFEDTSLQQNKKSNSSIKEQNHPQEQMNSFEQRLQTIESESEHKKKEVTVMHDLVQTFNQKLTEIETSSQESIHDVGKEVQSIKDNVNQMLSEIPQVNSIETRFASIHS